MGNPLVLSSFQDISFGEDGENEETKKKGQLNEVGNEFAVSHGARVRRWTVVNLNHGFGIVLEEWQGIAVMRRWIKTMYQIILKNTCIYEIEICCEIEI